MSLAFFRKREKLVFWVMIVLMVAFAAGVAGPGVLRSLGRNSGEGQVIGYAGQDKITVGDQRAAVRDLEILQGANVGAPLAVLLPGQALPGERGFLVLTTQDHPQLTWTLLTHEARSKGVQVAETQVDELLRMIEQRMGLGEGQFLELMAQQNHESEQVRSAIRNYLSVAQLFEISVGAMDVSEPEMRYRYEQLLSRISVAAVILDAHDFVDQAPEPGSAEIQALFDSAKGVAPGQQQTYGSFQFGYRQPPAVRLDYAFIDFGALREAVTPTNERIAEYFRIHQDDLRKTVRVESDTQPGDDGAVETREVPYAGPAEAREVIVERIKTETAQRRLDEIAERLMNRIEALEVAEAPATQADQTPLARAAGELIAEGAPVQYRMMGDSVTQQELFAEPLLAMARDRQGRPLGALAFSAGELGGEDSPLAGLVEVGRVYDRPLVAGTMTGRSGLLLFAVRDVEPGGPAPELTDEIRQQVVRDLRLASAFDLAEAEAQAVIEQARRESLYAAATQRDLEVAEIGPVARLNQASPARTPMQQQAVQVRQLIEMQVMTGQELQLPEGVTAEHLALAALMPPFELRPPRAVNPIPPAAAGAFIEAAFELAPTPPRRIEVETPDADDADDAATQPTTAPTTHPTSAPAEGDALAVLPLPGEAMVAVLQRVSYEPAYEGMLQRQRMDMLNMLYSYQRLMKQNEWFTLDAATRRVQWSENTGE